MDFAEAVNLLYDEVSSCAYRAEQRGLAKKEVVAELRRIAAEIEDEIIFSHGVTTGDGQHDAD